MLDNFQSVLLYLLLWNWNLKIEKMQEKTKKQQLIDPTINYLIKIFKVLGAI